MNLTNNPFSTPRHRPLAKRIRRLRALCTPEEIQTTLQLERLRSDRSGKSVSGVIFEANSDGGAATNKPSRTLRVAALVLRASRVTDAIGGLSSGQEQICALLPDTSAGGADCFARRVCALALDRGIDIRATVYCHAAEVGPTDESNHGKHNGQHRRGGEGPAFARDLRSTKAHPAYGQTSSLAIDWPSRPAASQPVGVPVQSGDVPVRSGVFLPLTHLLSYRMPLWKRVFDILGAIVGLILFSPVMVILAALIRLSTRGPILFMQRRTGWRGREFTIYKFRTMTTDAEQRKASLRKFSEQDGPAFKMTNDPRVTLIGRFLRATSLDELPQFWNVLLGNMSLVGPRPLPVEESNACSPWHRRRLDVTPGLTCIWQVCGRSSVAFDDWMRMDMRYIDRRSPLADLGILMLTIPAVALRKGAH